MDISRGESGEHAIGMLDTSRTPPTRPGCKLIKFVPSTNGYGDRLRYVSWTNSASDLNGTSIKQGCSRGRGRLVCNNSFPNTAFSLLPHHAILSHATTPYGGYTVCPIWYTSAARLTRDTSLYIGWGGSHAYSRLACHGQSHLHPWPCHCRSLCSCARLASRRSVSPKYWRS